jgi:hypothetical protein
MVTSSTDAEGSHPNPFTPLASHYPELRQRLILFGSRDNITVLLLSLIQSQKDRLS